MKARLLALLLLSGAAVAVAQGPSDRAGGPPNPTHLLERLTTLLDLTAAQQAQVKTILEAQHAKMKAQFEAARASGTQPTSDQMRALHQQLKADTLQQLTPVLTASQLKKFEVLMEEEGPRGRGHHGPAPGDAPPPASN